MIGCSLSLIKRINLLHNISHNSITISPFVSLKQTNAYATAIHSLLIPTRAYTYLPPSSPPYLSTNQTIYQIKTSTKSYPFNYPSKIKSYLRFLISLLHYHQTTSQPHIISKPNIINILILR
jgi:hypothetical protein